MTESNRVVRRYDEEFKSRAVKLFCSSNKSFKAVANDLGIPESTLAGWVYTLKQTAAMNESGAPTSTDLTRELKGLRRQLVEIKEERDILKKALAIFSTNSQKR